MHIITPANTYEKSTPASPAGIILTPSCVKTTGVYSPRTATIKSLNSDNISSPQKIDFNILTTIGMVHIPTISIPNVNPKGRAMLKAHCNIYTINCNIFYHLKTEKTGV